MEGEDAGVSRDELKEGHIGSEVRPCVGDRDRGAATNIGSELQPTHEMVPAG